MSIFEGDAYLHAERIANLLAPLRGNDDAAKAAGLYLPIGKDYRELCKILELLDQGDSPAIARIRFIVEQTRRVLSIGSMVQVLADSDLGDVARSGWRESLPSTSCEDPGPDDAGEGSGQEAEEPKRISSKANTKHLKNSEEIFKSALSKLHGFEESDRSVSNYGPFSNRDIEEASGRGISDSTAGRLKSKYFGSSKEYQTACRSKRIRELLSLLAGTALKTVSSKYIDSLPPGN